MPFKISEKAYMSLLHSLNNQHLTEQKGNEIDLSFLADDSWLGDTAVIDCVVYRRGMWEIHLIFAHYKTPCRLLKRIITTTYQLNKATLTAYLMKKLAAKDQRGTLKLDEADFKFNHN